jgi:glycosyltransferase involved in cell wall biosynthesis
MQQPRQWPTPVDGAGAGDELCASAIITTRNRVPEVVWAVRSVLVGTVADIEVVVVDQSDGEETRRALTAAFGGDRRVRYLRDDGVGIAHGRNTALTHARGAIIAITDDDCRVPHDWLARILAAFEHHPDVDLLYGNVDAPEHDYQHFVVPVCLLPESRVERGLGGSGARLQGIGANMALRRRLLRCLGGFDPAFGSGSKRWSGEDFELHYRALRANHAVLLEPEIFVWHLGIRPIGHAWALWERDALGCGALTARILADGDRATAWRFAMWNIGRILRRACFRLMFFQFPTGLRLALWMIRHSLRGFAEERRHPTGAKGSEGGTEPDARQAHPQARRDDLFFTANDRPAGLRVLV